MPLHDLITGLDEIPAATGRRVVAVDEEYRSAATTGLPVTATA
jgi:hypothetical protein